MLSRNIIAPFNINLCINNTKDGKLAFRMQLTYLILRREFQRELPINNLVYKN